MSLYSFRYIPVATGADPITNSMTLVSAAKVGSRGPIFFFEKCENVGSVSLPDGT